MIEINPDLVIFLAVSTTELKKHIAETNHLQSRFRKNPIIIIGLLNFQFFEAKYDKNGIPKEYVRIGIVNEALFDKGLFKKSLKEIARLNSKYNLNLRLKEYHIALDIANEIYNPLKSKSSKLMVMPYSNTTSYRITPVNNKRPDVYLALYDKEKEIVEQSKKYYQNVKCHKRLNRLELRLTSYSQDQLSFRLLYEVGELMLFQTERYLDYITEISKQIMNEYSEYFIFTDDLNFRFGMEYIDILEKYKIYPAIYVLIKYKDQMLIDARKKSESRKRKIRRLRNKGALPLKQLINEAVNEISTVEYLQNDLAGYLTYIANKINKLHCSIPELQNFRHTNDVRITNKDYKNEKISKIIINHMLSKIPECLLENEEVDNYEMAKTWAEIKSKYPENGNWFGKFD
ncbi:MAG: hypothetical protein V4670_02875 [Bacteroidota bacterium]